jgi:PAS domain S-box-containing protein
MIHRSEPAIVKRLKVFAASAAVLSIVVGVSVLVGWTLNIAALLTWGAGTPIAPNAGAGFVLAGFSLWLLRERENRPSPASRKLAARAAAAMVSLGGFLTLAEHLFRRDFGIDRLLLLRPPGLQIASFRILMSPVTAGAFLLFGLALQGIDWRTKRQYWVAQYVCLPAFIAPAFAVLGLLWGPTVSRITVPVPTGVAFLALTTGLLCSRPTWAISGLLTRQSPGTTLLRRALPTGMLVLGLIGWLISKPLLTGVHFTWFEVSALAIVTGALLAGFIGWTAIAVDRSDGQRKQLEQVLHLGQVQMDRLLEQVEEPGTEARLRRWAEAAITVAVLLTMLLSFLSWRGAQQAAENAGGVAHTHEVMTMLESTLRHSLDVETGGRGFAETGSAAFLEPYETGRRAVPQDLQALRQLLVTADQQQRLDVLEGQANTQVKDVEEIVAERQSRGRVPTVTLFAQGKHDMDAVRATVERMQVAERALLEQRSQRARAAEHATSVVITLGSLLGVVFLSIAGISVSREIGVSARARAQVKALNANLERRVEQRTAALEAEAAARQATETKLRTSEEMFRTLLDGIKDYAVYMLDVEGRVVSWNSGAARINGYSAEEIIGKHISCFYTANDRDLNRGQESLQEAAYTGRFEGQGWRVRKDGSTFWANAVITPLHEANGNLRGYSKVVRDITASKHAEEEQKKQAALLELALDAIFVRDLQSRVSFWNRGAQNMYGWSSAEVNGRVSHELLQTKFPLPLADIEAALTSKGEWVGELRHTTRTGNEVVVTSRWALQRDERGAPTAILEINRDITDRKLAEAALSESEGRLSGIIASAMDAIITVDDQQCILLFNRAAEKMFRCPEREAIGRPITRFIPQRFHAAHAGHIRNFGEKGVTNRAMGPMDVLWGLRADGQEFQIEASISQVVTRGKKLFTVILRDISERVQAQQAVMDAQARMAGIVSSAMDAIITVDSEQRIVVFNAAAATIFRCSAAEVVGQTIERFIPQRFRSAHIAHVAQFGETGTTNRAMGQLGALWAVRADGEEFQIEASISQVEIAGNKMFTVILRDVTERGQAERTRERLAAIVDSSDDAIISKTLEGTISAWNRGAEKLFGYPAAEAIGEPMLMLLPPERVEEEADILTRIGQGQSVEHFETVRVRKDGTRIDVSVTISPIRDAEGAIIGASKVARDITERKRAEAALRDSEASLRLALEAGRLGTWQWKLATDELEGSAVYLPMFGVPANAEFTFARFRAALHPQDRVVVDEAMRRCLGGLAEYDAEYRTIQPDGTERWIAARGQAYKNAGNETTHVRGIVSDITDRRHAQEALRESEERFQVMANGIQQLAWMAEADGSIFWYNQRWNEYTGTTLEQMRGWGWQSVHDPDVLPQVMEGWRAAIASGTPFDMEFPLRGADGSFRMFLTRVMPVRNAEGSVVRWLGTNTDISERKKAEEDLTRLAMELGQQAEELALSRQALEAQQLMLQSVLNSMVEGLVAADEQGKFILWNPAAEKIVGLGAAHLSPEEWSAHYGTYLPDMVTPFPAEQTSMHLAIQGVASSAELFIRHPGLSQGVWIESNGAPLRNKDGVVVGGVVAFRDITQRKADELEIRRFNEELEERIAERTAQLETANHELEAFSYSVSHDLRAPLRHIGGFSRILMSDFGSGMAPEAKGHLQRIDDAVIRMGMLVDGLLGLAKLGRRPLKLHPTELNVIVAGAISVLQPECEGREVEWRIAQLPTLECDGVLMGQVFQNLLSNALKYSRGRSKAVIEVDSVQQAGEPSVVFVRDNGAGFNMQYAEKLFGVFQRMHTDAEFEGTGVGLATVQRIVQKHGGRIWAEAETDHGATFYFTLGGNVETKTAARLTATAP